MGRIAIEFQLLSLSENSGIFLGINPRALRFKHSLLITVCLLNDRGNPDSALLLNKGRYPNLSVPLTAYLLNSATFNLAEMTTALS